MPQLSTLSSTTPGFASQTLVHLGSHCRYTQRPQWRERLEYGDLHATNVVPKSATFPFHSFSHCQHTHSAIPCLQIPSGIFAQPDLTSGVTFALDREFVSTTAAEGSWPQAGRVEDGTWSWSRYTGLMQGRGNRRRTRT